MPIRLHRPERLVSSRLVDCYVIIKIYKGDYRVVYFPPIRPSTQADIDMAVWEIARAIEFDKKERVRKWHFL